MHKLRLAGRRRALLASTVLLSCIVAGDAIASDCGCADVADLRNRLCEARAAMDEYSRQINMISAQEKKTGKPVMFSGEHYAEHIQPCVQEAINQVTDGKQHPTAETNGLGCLVTFSGGPNACQKKILLAHENVHVAQCMRRRNDTEGLWEMLRMELVTTYTTDYREGSTLIDVAAEERAAYGTEVGRIRDALDQLASEGCEGLPPRRRGPRVPSDDPCPSPKPRPAPGDSLCRHR